MTQPEKESEIKNALKGKTITAVHYYLINRPGYFYPNQPEQLVDAAVELSLSEETLFSFGMNFHVVAIDSHVQLYSTVIERYNKDIPFVKINVSTDEKWQPFIGKKINEVHICCNWFEDLDENRNYIPQDIEIISDDNLYTVFCATAYTLDEDGISILGPDSEGEILVLFDEEDTKYFKRGRYYQPEPMDLGEDFSA